MYTEKWKLWKMESNIGKMNQISGNRSIVPRQRNGVQDYRLKMETNIQKWKWGLRIRKRSGYLKIWKILVKNKVK